MKKLAFAAFAAAATMIAVPASAQTVSGTVTLTGSVAPKCLVLSEGPAASTFTRSVDFGELAAADGTLRTGLAGEFTSGVAEVRVVCTTATPTITLNATPMSNAATAGTGYDNSIDYTAHVELTLTGGGTAVFDDDSADPAALGPTAVGGRLAGSGNNMVITADGFATDNATDILVSGDYSGQISISIAPTA